MLDLGQTSLEPIGDTVLGVGNVTDGHYPDLLLRQRDGSLVVVEENGYGGTRRYVCGDWFDGAQIVGLADVTGDGHTDLIGVTTRDEVLVFPHAGVFWPQDPATTFGRPAILATGTLGGQPPP
jgi:hypothetical protein